MVLMEVAEKKQKRIRTLTKISIVLGVVCLAAGAFTGNIINVVIGAAGVSIGVLWLIK